MAKGVGERLDWIIRNAHEDAFGAVAIDHQQKMNALTRDNIRRSTKMANAEYLRCEDGFDVVEHLLGDEEENQGMRDVSFYNLGFMGMDSELNKLMVKAMSGETLSAQEQQRLAQGATNGSDANGARPEKSFFQKWGPLLLAIGIPTAGVAGAVLNGWLNPDTDTQSVERFDLEAGDPDPTRRF